MFLASGVGSYFGGHIVVGFAAKDKGTWTIVETSALTT
jgi:hypothetical protein